MSGRWHCPRLRCRVMSTMCEHEEAHYAAEYEAMLQRVRAAMLAALPADPSHDTEPKGDDDDR